jgi:hypothetical protein
MPDDSSTTPVPTRPANRKLLALKIGLTILVAAANISASGIISSGIEWTREGQQNADPSFIFAPLEAALIPLWALTGIALVIASIFPRGPIRHWARGGLLLCVIVLPFQCANHEVSINRYEAGFFEWVGKHVRPEALQTWCRSLPSVDKQTEIPQSSWPSEVSLLSPSHVYQLPNNNGLILEWGIAAAWGNSRRVFIGASDGIVPPTNDENIHFQWKKISTDMFGAYQETD